MNSDDLLYLQNILDAIEKVESYLLGVDRETFDGTSLIQDGVIRQITIMGEAVKLLSSDLRDKHSRVPWRSLARMRDTLIHRYFGVDLDVVWQTARNDLPVLKADVLKITEELRADSNAVNDSE